MFKELGAVFIFIGLVFTLFCWSSKDYESFLLKLLVGPVLLGLGLQLIK